MPSACNADYSSYAFCLVFSSQNLVLIAQIAPKNDFQSLNVSGVFNGFYKQGVDPIRVTLYDNDQNWSALSEFDIPPPEFMEFRSNTNPLNNDITFEPILTKYINQYTGLYYFCKFWNIILVRIKNFWVNNRIKQVIIYLPSEIQYVDPDFCVANLTYVPAAGYADIANLPALHCKVFDDNQVGSVSPTHTNHKI